MTTVTQWFEDEDPVHIGVYENESEGAFQFWNGRFWGYLEFTPELAEQMQDIQSMFQHDAWRGLAVKP